MTEKTLKVGDTIFQVRDVTIEREVVEQEIAPGKIVRIPTGRVFFYGTLEDEGATE